MSDDKEHPYSTEELAGALAAVAQKTLNSSCPFCGHQSWTYEIGSGSLLKPAPRVAYVPMTNHAYWGPAPSIPVFTLTCDNCGFVRHHSLPTLLKGRDNG